MPGAEGEFSERSDIAEWCKEREECEEAHKRFLELDRNIKEVCRGKEKIVCGDWLITGKKVVRKYKAQPARIAELWQTKIQKLSELGKEDA